MADERQAYRQDRLDAENGVVVTEIGRYIPPADAVGAAAVLVRHEERQAEIFGGEGLNQQQPCGVM